MRNLWTDHDDGAHRWMPERPGAAAPPPAPVPAEQTEKPWTIGGARTMVFGGACVAVACAGMLIEVLG
jgi:hypothetical protein